MILEMQMMLSMIAMEKNFWERELLWSIHMVQAVRDTVLEDVEEKHVTIDTAHQLVLLGD